MQLQPSNPNVSQGISGACWAHSKSMECFAASFLDLKSTSPCSSRFILGKPPQVSGTCQADSSPRRGLQLHLLLPENLQVPNNPAAYFFWDLPLRRIPSVSGHSHEGHCFGARGRVMGMLECERGQQLNAECEPQRHSSPHGTVEGLYEGSRRPRPGLHAWRALLQHPGPTWKPPVEWPPQVPCDQCDDGRKARVSYLANR